MREESISSMLAAATLDTIYDMASLTKPLVTALLCASLVERGVLGLDDRAARYLPEFDTDDKRDITLRQLLTHSAGLPAWRPLYLLAGGDKGRVLQAIAREPLGSAPGTHVVYSDLGYIALGLMLERLHGHRLAEIARREIFEPLGLRRTFFNPDRAFVTEIAACELGNAYEREMCQAEEAAARYSWRESLICTDMTPGMEEPRSVGWQLASMPNSTAGASLPPDSFGHLGFTGTSCWNDPSRECTFILLTNRTHARPLPFVIINDTRRQFHTLAVEALDGQNSITGESS
jgi:CubicO group peptidase (beta-lactamase class C family)